VSAGPAEASSTSSFDQDQSFMLVEIAGAELSFAAISRSGQTVDSGVIHKESKR